MDSTPIPRKIADKIQKIQKLLVENACPERIILFGSRADGRAHSGSDIDIAIENARKLSVREERKLKELLDEAAGIYSVDLVFLEKVDKAFADRIRETGIILKQGSVPV